MKQKLFGVALLSTTLLATAAFAQNTAPNAPAERSTTTTERTATTTTNAMHHAGQWRASKLPGINVYNEQNEKIGDVNDVILDSSGKASKVIVGVGGFLGMGEHDVALDFDKVKWVNEARATTATTTATTDDKTRTTTGTAVRRDTADKRDNKDWYPDHAVVSATKDQLKSMPEFKY